MAIPTILPLENSDKYSYLRRALTAFGVGRKPATVNTFLLLYQLVYRPEA